ncbi:MAG: YqaJ viral recombinase family protein [Bifidobacterium bifidum]
MHASLDGFIYDEASDSWGILEIKTANANRGRTDWHNDEGELIAPDYYMAQVTHYMAVTGFRWGISTRTSARRSRSRCASSATRTTFTL